MRHAKCLTLTSPVTVLGSKASLVLVGPIGQLGDPDYHPGWEGDLDQVVGDQDGEPLTLADALGPDLLVHFSETEPVVRGNRISPESVLPGRSRPPEE